MSGIYNHRPMVPGTTSSTPTPSAPTKTTGSANWSDDPDNVPPQLKREGPDWFA
ncbi:hypothetical protein BGX26_009211, partial [Mortierella sp. AD094]